MFVHSFKFWLYMCIALPMYDAPNAVEELKHPIEKKVEEIKDASKHFEVI